MVILPERGSERLADDVKCCTHIWNSLSSCTWRAGLLHKASAGTFSVSPVLFFLPRFLSQSLNLFLSLSLFTACRSAGMVTRCASAKKSEWTEAKGKRRDEAQEDSDMGEKYLPWSRREEVDNHIMSVSEEERGHEKKREGDGERESVTDAKREAERGLRSRNALTLETWLSVCIWHSTSCHSTGLSTHTHTHLPTHTHTHLPFALDDDLRRPRQEKATPSKELLTSNHTAPHPLTIIFASHPVSQKCPPSCPPSIWPCQPTCTTTQHAGAKE